MRECVILGEFPWLKRVFERSSGARRGLFGCLGPDLQRVQRALQQLSGGGIDEAVTFERPQPLELHGNHAHREVRAVTFPGAKSLGARIMSGTRMLSS